MKKIFNLLITILIVIIHISCNNESKIIELENKLNELESKQEILVSKIDNYISLNGQFSDDMVLIKEDLIDLKDQLNDLSNMLNDEYIDDFSKRIDDLEQFISELNIKIDNIINYKNINEEAKQIALYKLELYSKYMYEKNEQINDGLIFKVSLINDENNNINYYFVLYNNNLIEFQLNSNNDNFDVVEYNSNIEVNFTYGSRKCDRYFNLPTINGVDKLTDVDGNILYFYYYYGTSIENELLGNSGEYIEYPNNINNCEIYNGIVSTKSIDNKIKNIIFMIPDGAGFGSYDLANFVKKKSIYGIKNALTKTTNDRILGKTINGLYLDEYLVGTSSTALYNGGLTDSGAGGTALSSGYKTNYCAIGVDHEYLPKANILEVCMLEGKATGVVTTKSWIDATPSAFLSHSYYRTEQKDLSYQSLNSNVDVLLAYGTSNGSKQTNGNYLHDLDAYNKGYTVVNDKYDLYEEVYINRAKKIWSNFTEGSDNTISGADVSGYHISYDVYGKNNELSLLDMAKSALDVLNTNINDEDGFFLMIEGGAIDNAAHGRLPLESTGEYLAYDETFAYMVNFASQRDDTIVISVPDHDTGGYINPIERTDSLISSIISGNNLGGYTGNAMVGVSNDHTMQNVPLCFYGPDNVRTMFLNELGIPLDTNKSKIRTGNYYDGTVINQEYAVLNSSISHAILKISGLMSFDDATSELFINVNSLGNYDINTETFIFNNGIKINRNDNYYTFNNENISLENGRGIYIVNPSTNNNIFYMPKNFVSKYFG